MAKLRPPADVWSRWATLAALTLVAAPMLVLVTVAPGMQSLARLSAVSGMSVSVLCLVAALLFHLHWRLTRADTTEWLAAGAAVLASHGMALALVERSRAVEDLAPYRTATTLTVALLLAFLARRATSPLAPVGPDPMAAGLGLGLAVAMLHLTLAYGGPSWPLPLAVRVACSFVIVGTGVVLTLGLPRVSALPPWAQVRLQLGVLAVLLRHGLALHGDLDGPAGDVVLAVGTVAGILGAVLLSTTALGLVRWAIRDQQRMVQALRDRLAALEQDSRTDRERMHEVRGTLAGIASATELMTSSPSLDTIEQPELVRMVGHEVSRLHRMLHDTVPSRPVAVSLDEVLAPLVLRHRTQGHDVRWEPDGRWVLVVPDALAHAVSVLLANADRHAPGSPVVVRVTDEPGWVVIRVSDSGPGVPAAVIESLFTRGARAGPRPGSGIGLHLARRLLTEGSGRLTYDPSHRPGASFLIGLRHASPPDPGLRGST